MTRWAEFDDVKDAPPGSVVVPVEPRLGPWSGNNNLGQQVRMRPPGPVASAGVTVLKMPETGFPRMRTVSLWLDFDEAGLTEGVGFALYGSIIAGVGGTTQQFEVDWQNGAMFSIPFNAVEVTAHWDFLNGDIPRNFNVRAMMGDGGKPYCLPTRTIQGSTVLAGANGTPIRIPAFSTTMRVLNGLSVTMPGVFDSSVSVRFLDNPAGTPYGQIPANADGVAIPNRARYAQLVNGSGNPLDYFFQFELGL